MRAMQLRRLARALNAWARRVRWAADRPTMLLVTLTRLPYVRCNRHTACSSTPSRSQEVRCQSKRVAQLSASFQSRCARGKQIY